MKTKPFHGLILTLDNGETRTLSFLGKGFFHRCYLDEARQQVYSFTIYHEGVEEDYSKEMLVLYSNQENPHIPKVERLGSLDNTESTVYRMPFYHPLRASNTEAWAQYKLLASFSLDPQERYPDYLAYYEKILPPGDLLDALENLVDTMHNYGIEDYGLEFSPRNLKVDDAGKLILLDVVFNKKAVQQYWRKRSKTAARY